MLELFSEGIPNNFERSHEKLNHLNFANLFLSRFHACLATILGGEELELVHGRELELAVRGYFTFFT